MYHISKDACQHIILLSGASGQVGDRRLSSISSTPHLHLLTPRRPASPNLSSNILPKCFLIVHVRQVSYYIRLQSYTQIIIIFPFLFLVARKVEVFLAKEKYEKFIPQILASYSKDPLSSAHSSYFGGVCLFGSWIDLDGRKNLFYLL